MSGWPEWREEVFRVQGGMNEIDSETDLKPGTPRAAVNFECTIGAQPRRMDGYERFDGNTNTNIEPHRMNYFVLPFTSGNSFMPFVGGIVNDGTGAGSFGTIIEIIITSGSLSGGDAVGTLALLKTVLAIWSPGLVYTTVGGPIKSGATVCGTIAAGQGIGLPSGSTIADGYAIDASYAARSRVAQARARALVLSVPGSGPIRGLQYYNSRAYAWRDNAGGTACLMYRSGTNIGTDSWVLINFGEEVAFTAGSVAPVEGTLITQGAVTATVRRICLQSGDWGAGTASGRFVITGRAGGNFVAGAFTAGVTATCSGAATAITLLPGGRFECINHNFYGASNRFRMYGVDGVNRAFEFDSNGGPAGTNDGVFAPISTGMTIDTPDHIEAHRDYLFCSFPGGSLQNNGVGNPFNWTIRSGAGEFGLGDNVAAMKSLRGSVLAVMGRNSAKLLYGTGSSTWDLKPWLAETGAVPYCLQEIAHQALAFDQRGAYFVEATNDFGDFTPVMLTRPVQTTVLGKAQNAKGSIICRKKSQMRVYFNDKTGITGTFIGGKLIGWMPFQLANQFVCFASGEDQTGTERLFAGTDDGYVMELDVGTSHDGTAISSSLQMVASNQKLPSRAKVYHASELDFLTAFDTTVTLTGEIDYGKEGQGGVETQVIAGSTRSSTGHFHIGGEGVVLTQTLTHSDDIQPPFTVQIGRVLYSPRGIQR